MLFTSSEAGRNRAGQRVLEVPVGDSPTIVADDQIRSRLLIFLCDD